MISCRPDGDGVRFQVRLTPRSSKNEIQGVQGDELKVKVKAPPVDGQANEELLRFMAKVLGVARGDVTLVTGRSGRSKVLRVNGLETDEVLSRLGLTQE